MTLMPTDVAPPAVSPAGGSNLHLILAWVAFLIAIVAIAVLSGLHDPIPTILSDVAFASGGGAIGLSPSGRA